MVRPDPSMIKRIVIKHFNMSVDLYEHFEEEYGLFAWLALKLAEFCDIREGMAVCDVGCGTGISSFVLQKIVGSKGTVIGIDPSEKMLESAETKINNLSNSNIKFILGDADELDIFIDYKLDSVQYNATIFLVPEPENTLNKAYHALRNKGTVGMNYISGLYSSNGETVNGFNINSDLFLLTKQAGKDFAPYGRKITDAEIIPDILKKIGFKNIKKGNLARKMSVDELKAFYSIPAQSAGLWPRNEYKERLKLLDLLVNDFQENNISNFILNWGWIVAEA